MIGPIEQRRSELQELCRRYRVLTLELFGSAAEGSWEAARSDLDFLVQFLPDQDLGPWLSHYFEFKEQLEQLFERPVDLLLGGPRQNPFFIREVNRTRKMLYAA
jgi:predicted nucleotidyltransferase